uniref:DoxX family protein n=1 Tax=Pedobacter schmidteae TaxID=2201271 RepID=UPI000EB0CDB8|nr:DoxX family protein [Pedobacter schmidteae]
MKQLIFGTNNDWVGLILRLTTGLIMFPHGAQKTLGWFGGPGFSNEMEHLQHLGISWIIALMVILIEFFGAISLVLGFASRLWAFAFIILFIGIIFTAHIQYGFFMNWFGKQQGEGFEYHLLVIGLCLALLLNGSGKLSLDNLITSK